MTGSTKKEDGYENERYDFGSSHEKGNLVATMEIAAKVNRAEDAAGLRGGERCHRHRLHKGE